MLLLPPDWCEAGSAKNERRYIEQYDWSNVCRNRRPEVSHE